MKIEDVVVTCTIEDLHKLMVQSSIEGSLVALNQFHASKNRLSPETLLNYNQAAKRMGKSYGTVKRLVDSGKIIPTADGKFISVAEIEKYVNPLKK